MLQNGQDVFVSFAGGSELRILHAARVVDRTDEALTIRFDDPETLPTEQTEAVTMFFDGPSEFMQQPAGFAETETESEDTESTPGTFTITPIGQPVSAESRKCYRVGTVLADYTANLGRLGRCKVVDVSAAGVGFLNERKLKLGDSVDIEINVHGKVSSGSGFVQSIKEVKTGYRYGLLCVEDKGKGGLAKGLQQLTMDAQRTQLRRLAGAA